MSPSEIAVTPFRVDVPQEQLDDLADRLARARWPEAETVGDTSQGVPLAFLRNLVDHWANGYDWRRLEGRLNDLPQFRTQLTGGGDDPLEIHFLHVRSPRDDATPMLLTHGWPGSVLEFLDVIEPLTQPDDGDPAFHLVIPSLPGYGFSAKPTTTGWGPHRIAAAWAELMSRLGYQRYLAQGGDWGSIVTSSLGELDTDHLLAIHLNMPLAAPDADADDLTEAEQAIVAHHRRHRREKTGYMQEQSTRPQTIGYSLVDSPVGLAAWIVEKFWDWTDHDGDPLNILTADQMIDAVMMYWLPATGASSARLYWESPRSSWNPEIAVPVGISMFPREINRTTERWARKRYPTLSYWNELERGGHFAALEQPHLFVDEIRAWARTVVAVDSHDNENREGASE